MAPPKPLSRRRRSGRVERTDPLTAEEAVVDILRKAAEPMESALLRRELTNLETFRDFNQKAHGFRTWTSFLRSIDEIVIKQRSDLGIEVGLRVKKS
ncbi:MAG: hypothetical protein KDB53_21170 [Planctomycetes bacterium]|nr:hypothetical protein [Planctomycetota bacterium]